MLPDGIKVIEENTFFDCENLEEIILPSTLEEIKKWSFHNCTKLTSIKLPDNLNTIAAEAFTDCQSLRNLVLPEGISCIGENAFYGCNQLSLKPAPKTNLLSANSYSLSYIHKWQKEKKGVILRDRCGFYHPHRISCALPESTADKIFVFHVEWGKEKPRIGGKNTLTVYYPFCCLIGDSFYLGYGPDEYIKAKLLNAIKKEDDKAVIKIEVIDKKKIYSTVKRLSEKEKEKLRQASTLYDYNRPNYYEQISDQVFLFWDDCQGDYYFSDSFYTDEDGIDHLVERYSDNISVIEDRVIGFHEYCPIDRNSGFLLGETLKNNNQEAVARSSNLQAYGKYHDSISVTHEYGIYYNYSSQYELYQAASAAATHTF